MVYQGHVENGVVVLDDDVRLPEGIEVKIEPVGSPNLEKSDDCPTLYERLKPVVGIVDGLPEDFSENHDHYVHGQPKR